MAAKNPASVGEARTLVDLGIGESCVVAKVAGRRRTVVRLLELGLVRGTVLTLRRRAPLGDPLEIEIRGYSLSLRKEDALHISILPVTEESRVAVSPLNGSNKALAEASAIVAEQPDATSFG